MTQFSANLGFLWKDLPLPDAIHEAHKAGFDAVECHWPYDTPLSEVSDALAATGLPMLGLNTVRGDVAAGEMGLCALPGREAEATGVIDQALDYARGLDCKAVHVMAGNATGPEAHACFIRALRYACTQAQRDGVTCLIEPLNAFDAPQYFLRNMAQARAIIDEVKAPNLKVMFDCYHVARTEGDVMGQLRDMLPLIGHIQFAGVPDRGRPDKGDLDYRDVFRMLSDQGWTRPLGAEYTPGGLTEDTLDWMSSLRG